MVVLLPVFFIHCICVTPLCKKIPRLQINIKIKDIDRGYMNFDYITVIIFEYYVYV